MNFYWHSFKTQIKFGINQVITVWTQLRCHELLLTFIFKTQIKFGINQVRTVWIQLRSHEFILTFMLNAVNNPYNNPVESTSKELMASNLNRNPHHSLKLPDQIRIHSYIQYQTG